MVGLWKLTCMKKYYITLVHGAVLVTGCSKGTIQLPFQRVREPPSYHFENYSKENIPHRLLFSCLPLRLFPVAFVYYSPLWFPCNGGEILNNLFSLQGKKIVLLNEPREGSYADGFSFSVFSSKYWNVYYVVQEEEWDETIFRRPAQIALGK